MDAAQITPGSFYTWTNRNYVALLTEPGGPIVFVVKVVNIVRHANYSPDVTYEYGHGGRGVMDLKQFAALYSPAIGPARTYHERDGSAA